MGSGSGCPTMWFARCSPTRSSSWPSRWWRRPSPKTTCSPGCGNAEARGIVLDAVTLLDARQEFLDYLAERNKSLRTVRTYGFAINKFLAFAAGEGLPSECPPNAVTSQLLRAYSRHLFHQRLSASGRKTYLVALTAWFKHLAAAEICQVNTDAIELPKVTPAPPNPDERLPDMLRGEPPPFENREQELS